MNSTGLARLSWMRARREPGAALFCCVGPALAVALALIVLALADAVLVRAEIFVGQQQAQPRLFVSRAAPSLGAFALGAPELLPIDMRDVLRLKQIPGVMAADSVVSLPVATSVAGGESLLGRALMIDVLVEGVLPAMAQINGFEHRAADDQPVPVIVHPQLLALFNATVAPNLRLPILAPSALLGQTGMLHVGQGRLAHRQPAIRPMQVPIVLVGLSPVASPLGLSMPVEDAARIWREAMATEAPPPLKGVWLTMAEDASLLAVARHVQRFGLSVDAQSEQGVRALALGRRAAHLGALLVWLAVALGNLQREWMLGEQAREFAQLLRLWGVTPWQRACLQLGQIGMRALLATGSGVALARVAIGALSQVLEAIGQPLGFDVVALGPPLQIESAWILAAFFATAGVSTLTLVLATRTADSARRAVC